MTMGTFVFVSTYGRSAAGGYKLKTTPKGWLIISDALFFYADGGRRWTRTIDLVIISDAL